MPIKISAVVQLALDKECVHMAKDVFALANVGVLFKVTPYSHFAFRLDPLTCSLNLKR